MKKLLKKSPLCFIAFIVGLLIPTFFLSCKENPVGNHEAIVRETPAYEFEPDFPTDATWNMIYKKYYELEDIDVKVEISYNQISITCIDPFEIENCSLYVNDEEIEFRYSSKNYYVSVLTLNLLSGEIYRIKLVINDITYETELRIYHYPMIITPNHISNPKFYTFTWNLEHDYTAQFVGVTLKDKLDFGDTRLYLLTEIEPSKRSFSINLDSLPSSYEFKGVAVRGVIFEKNDNVLLINNLLI